MDVEITGTDVTEKKLFSFTDLTADQFFCTWGRGEGYLVDIMALGVDAYLLGGAYSRKYGIND